MPVVQPEYRFREIKTSHGLVMIPYILERSKRLRTMRLMVTDASQVTLRIPSRCPERMALEFLESQGDWLLRTLRNLPKRLGLREYLQKYPWLSAEGRRLRVELGFSRAKTHYVFDLDQRLVLFRCFQEDDYDDALQPALKDFAKEVLSKRSYALADKVGAQLRRVTIRDQRTMWGSCTNRATLSLNWRLVLLRPDLQDHVIYHELAHLTHLDHSSNFYALLQRYDPRSVVHDHQVSKVSPQIMALGR